jgi:hypothetical protein
MRFDIPRTHLIPMRLRSQSEPPRTVDTRYGGSSVQDVPCTASALALACRCAAPGSKTLQLLEMLHANSAIPTGVVIANDIDMQVRCSRSKARPYPVVHALQTAYPSSQPRHTHSRSTLPTQCVRAAACARFALPKGAWPPAVARRILSAGLDPSLVCARALLQRCGVLSHQTNRARSTALLLANHEAQAFPSLRLPSGEVRLHARVRARRRVSRSAVAVR